LFRRICIAGVVVLLSAGIEASAEEVPTEEVGFTDFVAKQVRAELAGEDVVVKSPLTLKVGDLQANLDRIFSFCKKNADGCQREVTTYVHGIAQTVKDRNTPPTKEEIRVVVRTEEYAKSVQSSAPPVAQSLQATPFVKGFVLIPVLDSPRTIRMFSEKDGKALGLTPQDAQRLGLENLRAALKPLMEVAKPAGHGQIGQIIGDPYNSSRLALIDTWAPLAVAQGGTLIVAVPTTDAVLYVGEDSAIAIDALRTLVRNVMVRAPNRLSDRLLRWTESGWQVVP